MSCVFITSSFLENSCNNIKNYIKLGDVLLIIIFFYVIFFPKISNLKYSKYIRFCKKEKFREYFKSIHNERNNLIYI